MSAPSEYLLSVDNLISIYGTLVSSINTIWNIYVFVLLGMVGWIIARAHAFQRTQKILITVVYLTFNTVVIFYFWDAYADVDRVRADLREQHLTLDKKIVQNGISDNLVNFDPISRLRTVLIVIVGLGVFVLFIVWSNQIWTRSQKKPTSPN